MPRPGSAVGASLAARANGLYGFLDRVEQLANERRLSRTDVNRAYSGAFIAFYADLELAIEGLFMGILLGRLKMRRKVRPLIAVKSDRVARLVVRGSRRYVDWLPYADTKNRALTFLAGGEPFKSLPSAAADSFEKARILRNALAHGGDAAMKRFADEFTNGLVLPPDQRNPAGYLRGQFAPGTTRFRYITGNCLFAVHTLSGS